MDNVMVRWYDHIELAGIFLVGVYIVGTIVRVLIEKWLGKKDCTDCTEIKRKQSILREETLPKLFNSISAIEVQQGVTNTKLDLIMKGLKLGPEDSHHIRDN